MDVSLKLRSGCVHALVGENGAGKTTLGHVLAGVQKPDAGELTYDGNLIHLPKRKSAALPRIELIRQRNHWPLTLKLWEAAVLGRSDCFKGAKTYIEDFQRTAEFWDLKDLDARCKLADMDGASLQRAQLAAALMFNPGILILDEPASSWEEGRSGEFFAILDKFKEKDIAVLLITHRLGDVFKVADDVTVMRHGRRVAGGELQDFSVDEITRAMFDDELPRLAASKITQNTNNDCSRGNAVLSCRSISCKIAGRKEIDELSFDLHAGEVFSITGLREGGLAILEHIVSGQITPNRGKLLIDGRVVKWDCAAFRKAGLRYVPSDALVRGASLKSTLADNIVLLETKRLTRGPWLHPGTIRRWAEKQRRSGGIKGSSDQKLEELSGGNIQKIILQRELEPRARLLVLADPAMGLDERTRRKIRIRLEEMRASGCAILLLTSDLDEAMEYGGKMAVLNHGRLSDIRPLQEWTRHEAVKMIVGMGGKL